MFLRNLGSSEDDQKDMEQIRTSFSGLTGQVDKIQSAITSASRAIESAKESGCVRPSLMGPSPGLARWHTLEKKVLQEMLQEAMQHAPLSSTRMCV